MTEEALPARTIGPPAAATALLGVICVARFVFPDVSGIMMLSVIPITLLGMMLGWRAGLTAATAASAVFFVWAATEGHIGTLDYADQPLAFFLLGGLSGFYAHGALGDYDIARAVARGRLRRAIAANEIVLHYQPIVDAGDLEVLAVEALARWHDPSRGTIEPAEFIPLAEGDRQTILELTLHTLEVAARDISGWTRAPRIPVVVNLSPAALEQPELPGALATILERTGLPADRLGIEVTESAVAGEQSSVADALGEIRGLDLKIVAIDDFGVGHSSIARLGRLPIDTLKIDQRLVADCLDEETRPVVKGIIALAHTLELTAIGEGVEDERTRRSLAEWGCDAVQGNHVCRPLPPEELARWLEQR